MAAEQLFLRLRRVLDPDDAAAAAASPSARAAEVDRLLDGLLQALRVEERSETPPLGEVLEHLLENNSLGSLVDLVLDQSGDPALRAVLLRWYAEAIDRLDGAWLSHSAVNKPLTKLIGTCLSLGVDFEHELDFVTLLCVVSERIRSTPDLLPVFFRRRRASRERVADPPLSTRIAADFDPPLSPTLSQASTSENSFAFSASQAAASLPSVAAEYDCAVLCALVRYLHREGDLGEAARTGLLALIDVACSQTSLSLSQAPLSGFGGISDERRRSIASSPASASTPVGERDLVLAFSEWILNSDLADVLGASLGALYGALPTKLVIRPVDDSSAALATSAAAAPGGMMLGGMGALQQDEDAEITARRRLEEDEALQSHGYGISGTVEFTRGLDHFLRLFAFAQEVVGRCAAVAQDDLTVGGSRTPDAMDATRRQQQLVLAAVASTITTAVRLSFLQSVFYPSLLECSETDGSAVAILTYLDAVLEVLHEDGDFEAAVFAFLTGDDSRVEIPPVVARLRANKTRPSPVASKHNRRRSQGLVLLDRPASRTPSASSTDYYVSTDRFGLRDLLEANIGSTHAATATAALKLFKTILTKHDRWSLTLLDVELDDFATAFPAVPFASLPAAPDEVNSSSERAPDIEGESDGDEFVYPVRTPSPPRRQISRASVPPTPLSALRPLLDVESLSGRIDKDVSADPLDVLLSLIGETTPSYQRRRSAEGRGGGGGSELVATGFQNYLRDAESKLARDLGFRRGLASLADVPEGELSSTSSPPRSPLLQGDAPAAGKRPAPTNHHELATTRTGRRHRLTAASSSVSPVVSSLLAALSVFFSHPPDVNLALTEAIATLALSPYRALDPWCLPNEVQAAPLPNGGRRSTLFVAPDQLPTLAQSDSVLAVLQALSGSIAEYRKRIPKFDDYLDDRRKGLFFADNLADALEGIDLAPESHPNGLSTTPAAPPTPPLEPSPLAPTPRASSVTAGLASFFSPRRRPPTAAAAHSRSPSTPPPPPHAFSTPTRSAATAGSTDQHRPSQLRRSASDESLAAPLSPTLTTRLGGEVSDARGAGAGPRRLEELVEEDRQGQRRQRSTDAAGPASPFATHYRETGSVRVEPILVATPSQVRLRRATSAGAAAAGEVDDEEDGDDGPEASPSRRLSPLPPLPPNPSVDATPTLATDASRCASATGHGTVSLSTLLDNVIVLEEFVKELAAVVYVRRALGIDPVRRVDTD